MAEELLIILIGLLPCILSVLGFRQMLRRSDLRLQQAIALSHQRQLRSLVRYHETPTVKRVLGRADCRFSARSAYLRCAVNLMGDCESCRWFESVSMSR